MTAGVRANLVKVRVLSEASETALETAINDFLAALKQDTLLSIAYQANGTVYTALISYTR